MKPTVCVRGWPGDRARAEAVVLGALAVGGLDEGVVPAGLRDAGFEVVDDHPLRDAAEELEGALVAAQPGGHGLVEDEGHEAVAAPSQGHDKGPGRAGDAGVGILQAADRAEIDLGFLAGGALDADGGGRGAGFEGAHEAVDGGVTAGVALLGEALVEGGDLDALGAEGEHLVAVGGDGGDWTEPP